MARDGSGGVGWLITFACLALVGLIGAGVLYIDSSNARKQVEAESNQRKQAEARARNLTTKVAIMSAIIGNTNNTNADVIKQLEQVPDLASHPEQAEITKLINDFKAKLDLFGPNYTEARNLNTLVSYLMDELNRKNQALVDEQNKTTKMLDDVAKAIDENKKIAEEALKGQQKAEADLAAARAEFDRQLAANTAKMNELAKMVDDAKKQVAVIPKLQQDLVAKESELSALRTEYERQRAILNAPEADLAKVPVADVIYANQLANTITINRGLRDGVRRQMTLSVYSKNETNIARATPKASVEVVQITGPHRAECRIISGKVSDPIIAGDILYTPAWKPGQKVHFALGPNMDLDGDGEATPEELETLRGLIALNGGVVDAYVAPDGTIKADKESGGIGFTTRFYVVGLAPRRDQKEVAQKIEEQAEKFGVEKINLSKMLDYMGYQVKRATRPIVSSAAPIIERRPPGAGQPVVSPAQPAAPATREPAAEPGDDPFGDDPPADEPKKGGAEPKDDPFDDPFADPPK